MYPLPIRLFLSVLTILTVSILTQPSSAQTLSIPEENLFQDSFPQTGNFDVSIQANRDLLDVRIDAAVDVDPSIVVVSRDELIGTATPVVGETVVDVTLHYSLNMNPLFESAIRSNAPTTAVASGLFNWNQSEGSVVDVAGGGLGAYNFSLDLPDADFMYPGDVLEYYVEVEFSDGITMVKPPDISGFDDPSLPYDTRYTMRALPTYSDFDASQPSILLVNNNGHGTHENNYDFAMKNNGLHLGEGYDIYTVNVPDAGHPNGIGSAGTHGASADQLAGYETILYTTGARTDFLLNDGSGIGSNTDSPDIDVLTDWYYQLGEDRNIALFGENLPTYLDAGSVTATNYLLNIMSVDAISTDVRPLIGGADNPTVDPIPPYFFPPSFGVGGTGAHPFDEIDPLGIAAVGHEYQGITPQEPASVVYEWTDGNGGLKKTVTFPFTLASPFAVIQKAVPTATTAAKLVEDLLNYFNTPQGVGPLVSAPSRNGGLLRELELSPNPFNPATEISFRLGDPASVRLSVFDLRGRLVFEKQPRRFDAGRNTVLWSGLNRAGEPLASGVYVLELSSGDQVLRQKATLLK